MGGEESREEKELEGLPIVNGKYKMCSVLGAGNFGGVYKVQDVKTKMYYALKCVPIDALPGVNKNQQKVVYQTALTEKRILGRLDHPNLVKLHDSFEVGQNPMLKKSDPMYAKKIRYFCLLLEYCHGNTLEAVIQKIENAKVKKMKIVRKVQRKEIKRKQSMLKGETHVEEESEESEEEQEPTTGGLENPKKKKKKKNKKNNKSASDQVMIIPQNICLEWFIKLLDTVDYVHSKNIAHVDLHPENVLLCYDNLSNYRRIDLRLSDFGVAKEISPDNLPRDLSGQLFYASPETVNQLPYDQKTDIWSLGIIFVNCYSQISMENYIKRVQKLFLKIKTNIPLRDAFCERYKIKNPMAVHQVPFITMINFMHEHESGRLFREEVIDDLVDDPGIRHVLTKMLCPVDTRMSSHELRETREILTWKYLLDRKCTYELPVETVDMLALMTVLKIKYDRNLFDRCLMELVKCFMHGEDNPIIFLQNHGIEILLNRMEGIGKLYHDDENENDDDDDVRKTEDSSSEVKKKKMIDKDKEEEKKYFEQLFMSIVGISMVVLKHLKMKIWNQKQEQHNIKTIIDYEELFDSVVRRVVNSFRENQCFKVLKKLILTIYSQEEVLLYFTYIMCMYSKTICKQVTADEELMKKLISSLSETFAQKKNLYICAILDVLMYDCTKEDIKTIIELYAKHAGEERKNDVRFCRRFNFRNKDSEVAGQIAQMLVDEIKKYSATTNTTTEEKRMEQLLSCLIFMMQDYDQKHKPHPERLLHALAPPSPEQVSLEFASSSKKIGMDQVSLLEEGSRSMRFICISPEKNPEDQPFVQVISSQPILKVSSLKVFLNQLQKLPDDNCCIGYFEVLCEDGGICDDMMIGLTTVGIKTAHIHLRVSDGTVEISELGRKKSDGVREKEKIQQTSSFQFSPDHCNPFICESGDSFGCGVTKCGNVFFTKNNTVIGEFPFFNMSKLPKNQIALRASCKVITGNIGFRARLVFGYLPKTENLSTTEEKVDDDKKKKKKKKQKKKKKKKKKKKSLFASQEDGDGDDGDYDGIDFGSLMLLTSILSTETQEEEGNLYPAFGFKFNQNDGSPKGFGRGLGTPDVLFQVNQEMVGKECFKNISVTLDQIDNKFGGGNNMVKKLSKKIRNLLLVVKNNNNDQSQEEEEDVDEFLLKTYDTSVGYYHLEIRERAENMGGEEEENEGENDDVVDPFEEF